jgi:hypothetical protein
LLLFFWWWYWSLNSGLCTCWAGALPLEPHTKSFSLFDYQTDFVTATKSWLHTTKEAVCSMEVEKKNHNLNWVQILASLLAV